MKLNREKLEVKQRRLLEERYGQINDDNDISIASAWDRQQNVESSEKLLRRLEFYHGDRSC